VIEWSEGATPGDARCTSRQPSPPCEARDVYCCFDNDAKVMAPRDAATLTCMLETAGARMAGKSGSGMRFPPPP
jgi:hypothetical protein